MEISKLCIHLRAIFKSMLLKLTRDNPKFHRDPDLTNVYLLFFSLNVLKCP